MKSNRWAILTGEYPPAIGGVSDYSRQVAIGLARRGQEVHVFVPGAGAAPVQDAGVIVHPLPDHFGLASLAELSRQVDRLGSARILVQYVPHAFGMRAMNLPFCLWLYARSSRNEIWTMFHEVSYPFRTHQPLRHQVIAAVNHVMAMLVGVASDRIFVSIPRWRDMLEALGVSSRIILSPIPSNVPLRADPACVAGARAMASPDGQVLVGHFGTYGSLIVQMLDAVLPGLLRSSNCRLVLMGRGSERYAERLCEMQPALRDRIGATGALAPDALAAQLAACDLLVQPYPDGISGRRGTAIAGLALGMPIVSNLGALSEDFWRDSHAIALARSPDPAEIVEQARCILADESSRRRVAARARVLYAERFNVERTIDRLLES